MGTLFDCSSFLIFKNLSSSYNLKVKWSEACWNAGQKVWSHSQIRFYITSGETLTCWLHVFPACTHDSSLDSYYTAMIKFLTSKPCTTLSFIWLYPYSKRGDGMGRRLHRWSKNTSFVEVGVGTWNDLQLYRQKGKERKEETYPDPDPDQTPKNLQKELLRVDPTEWVGGGYQLLLSPVKSS